MEGKTNWEFRGCGGGLGVDRQSGYERGSDLAFSCAPRWRRWILLSWGFWLHPPSLHPLRRAGKPGSQRGSPEVGARNLHCRASRWTSGCLLPGPLPREKFPRRMRGGGRYSQRVPGRVEERRGRREEKRFLPTRSLLSNPGQDRGSIVPVLTALSWGLAAKCCYHLLALSKNTSIRGSLAYSPTPSSPYYPVPHPSKFFIYSRHLY